MKKTDIEIIKEYRKKTFKEGMRLVSYVAMVGVLSCAGAYITKKGLGEVTPVDTGLFVIGALMLAFASFIYGFGLRDVKSDSDVIREMETKP